VRTKVAAAVPRQRVEFVQILSDVINDLAGAARPVEIKMFGAGPTSTPSRHTPSISSLRCPRSKVWRTSSTA